MLTGLQDAIYHNGDPEIGTKIPSGDLTGATWNCSSEEGVRSLMRSHQLGTAREEQFEKQKDGKGQKNLYKKSGNLLIICRILWESSLPLHCWIEKPLAPCN